MHCVSHFAATWIRSLRKDLPTEGVVVVILTDPPGGAWWANLNGCVSLGELRGGNWGVDG
jgi:hypothetical protein